MRTASIKAYLKTRLDKDGFFYYCLLLLRRRPISFPFLFLYSLWLSKKLTGLWWPIKIRFYGKFIPVKISAKRANVVAKGNLIIESWQNGDNSILISLGENSTLKIEGNFIIGQGVKISVGPNAILRLGGQFLSSGSGITCDTMIMASKSIEIGKDVIIAWGVYIMDSDWHTISGRDMVAPVVIGDHVWISHDVSVLKGVSIGQGSIIGAKSLVVGNVPENCLAAGIPAKIIQKDVAWTR